MASDTKSIRECEARVGATIDGRYRLDALLGVGATSAVYRTTNLRAGRECALKLFLYAGENQEMVLQRFVREAQVANRIRRGGRLHPNVVDALDVGRDADTGMFFMVQELLHGETLSALLARQPQRRLDLRAALALLRPAVDVLACAHEAGIIHRDIKPDNVMLIDDGPGRPLAPKVLDFGIAQLRDARMTTKQEMLGTLQYMSPESFGGARDVDARTDVWALGVMLYEALSGSLPFDDPKGSPFAIMRAVTQEFPGSLASAGRLNSTYWTVIRRCLAKDPDARYPDAAALGEALDAAAADPVVLKVPPAATPAALAASLRAPGNPARAWTTPAGAARPDLTFWRVALQRSGHDVASALALLEIPELAHALELHLSDLALGARAGEALAASPTLQRLTGLSLRGCGLAPESLDALGRSPNAWNLLGLDLADNPVGARAAAALRGGGLRGLRILGLSNTGLGDDEAAALAMVPALSKLARLDLSNNRVGERGAMALAGSPFLASDLTLVLGNNPLPPAASEALRASVGPRVRSLQV